MVPVYRWSAQGSVHLAQGSSTTTAAAGKLAGECFDYAFGNLVSAGDACLDELVRQLAVEGFCSSWSADSRQLSVCAPIRHLPVGQFVLSIHLVELVAPAPARIAAAGDLLLATATAIAAQSEVGND